jgi:hypothetical protein
MNYVPKYKAGDCITMYGSNFVLKIQSIMETDYGVLLGGNCDIVNWYKCSRVAYDIVIVDKNASLTNCNEGEK